MRPWVRIQSPDKAPRDVGDFYRCRAHLQNLNLNMPPSWRGNIAPVLSHKNLSHYESAEKNNWPNSVANKHFAPAAVSRDTTNNENIEINNAELYQRLPLGPRFQTATTQKTSHANVRYSPLPPSGLYRKGALGVDAGPRRVAQAHNRTPIQIL